MRFEIRTGGALAILIGLGLLSGSVFLLGLVAGYEMGHQQEGNRQFASVYPLPAPPAAASSPSAGAGAEAAPAPVSPASAATIAAPVAAEGAPTPEAAASTPEVAVAPGGVASAPPPPAPPQVAPAPVAVAPAPAAPAPMAAVPAPVEPAPAAPPPPAAIASEPVAPAKPPPAQPAAAEGSGSASARGEPEITSPVSQRHRGYSIQIEAVMDRSGADAMVAKLRHLGYESYLVETLIGSQTWYRVRIGPFATEALAQATEKKLHDQYTGSVSAP